MAQRGALVAAVTCSIKCLQSPLCHWNSSDPVPLVFLLSRKVRKQLLRVHFADKFYLSRNKVMLTEAENQYNTSRYEGGRYPGVI